MSSEMPINRRKSTPKTSPRPTSPQDTAAEDGEDFHRTLSEVASPEPIERVTEADLARRPSLDQRLSSCSHAERDAETDMFEALSEVATPEPVKRCEDEEIRRRPSLDRSLSRASGRGKGGTAKASQVSCTVA
ncbi:hypothetical protein BDV59DRAFT_197569 [Aspergillus ambiguus]|uniref:uncharacterized protein n=1 Tax=Aspergillus ambiguus TaxID=176160 RepID=UPI003CCCCB14